MTEQTVDQETKADVVVANKVAATINAEHFAGRLTIRQSALSAFFLWRQMQKKFPELCTAIEVLDVQINGGAQ